ncbi:MAG: TIGR02757 family protein [Deltaproteobacteria bacterium]|nr:TIGR02757 family protein [Deltaproteobacteria bacterium]
MRFQSRLKQTLDVLYRRYARPERIAADPIEFPHRCRKPEDIEVAGFIAAMFSYGRVDLFKPVIERVLSVLGDSPVVALRTLDVEGVRAGLGRVSYRFNRTDDIAALLWLFSQLVCRRGSLGGAFFASRKGCARDRLSDLRMDLLSGSTTEVYGRPVRPPGLLQLLPDPASGSASKRMYMFLRWMVRRDAVDFGLWHEFGTENLVMPLDTHVARIARNLGFTLRRAADYKTAVEVTDALRRFDARDPVKYDFTLAHLGISGECPARPSPAACKTCPLARHCRAAA